MNAPLNAYLARIGYEGQQPKPDLATLTALHRAHLLAIPYENLEIHRGGYLTVNEADFFRKIVEQHRGGWCYEMNGLFAWALREIGFDVTLIASTVNRPLNPNYIEGSHLILSVLVDGKPYLADVGFGNGLLEPIPLEAGDYQQRYLTYGLTHDGERWWFRNQVYGGAGFDFTQDAQQLSDFAAPSHKQQTWEESGFVRTTVCHRFTPEGFVTLRGATLTTITEAGRSERVIDNAADYRAALADIFDLHLDDTDALWEKVWARHQAWANSTT